MRSLVWFRNDLRTHDHLALSRAMDRGETVAVFVEVEPQWREHGLGARRITGTLASLNALSEELALLNVPLKILRAETYLESAKVVAELAEDLDASCVFLGPETPLDERGRDKALRRLLERKGRSVVECQTDTVIPPGQVMTGQGTPYTVFTPFFKNWYPRFLETTVTSWPSPQQPIAIKSDPLPIVESELAWGTAAAQAELEAFVHEHMIGYAENRDIPSLDQGTSRLSRHLTVGSVSANECAHLALAASNTQAAKSNGASKWIAELAWRDFYRHLMYHFDHLSRGDNMKAGWEGLEWRYEPKEFIAWCEGKTGYPIVDAGMRQLNTEGWMHNRVRMVVSMFLTKHLLHDWRIGEQYFLEHLYDADFASNNGGWQWSAGTGADAAPYFRIFNPMTQAQKFDPEGVYIGKYLGDDFDLPIVEHRFARERALDFFGANR